MSRSACIMHSTVYAALCLVAACVCIADCEDHCSCMPTGAAASSSDSVGFQYLWIQGFVSVRGQKGAISHVLKHGVEVLPVVETRCNFFHTSTIWAVCSIGDSALDLNRSISVFSTLDSHFKIEPFKLEKKNDHIRFSICCPVCM